MQVNDLIRELNKLPLDADVSISDVIKIFNSNLSLKQMINAETEKMRGGNVTVKRIKAIRIIMPQLQLKEAFDIIKELYGA